MTSGQGEAQESVSPAVRGGRPAASEQGQVEARLFEAARAIFVECGYANTTIDAIVKRARASKRTVYSRFPDKAALFEAVVADVIDRRFEPTEAIAREAAADSALSVRDRLLRIGEAFLEAATNPVSIALDAMVSAEARNFPMLAARLQARGHDRAVAIVGNLLAQAGARRATHAAEAFYALLVISPMRSDRIQGVVPAPDCDEIVEFVMAGAGLTA